MVLVVSGDSFGVEKWMNSGLTSLSESPTWELGSPKMEARRRPFGFFSSRRFEGSFGESFCGFWLPFYSILGHMFGDMFDVFEEFDF